MWDPMSKYLNGYHILHPTIIDEANTDGNFWQGHALVWTQPQYYREHALVYPNHSITGSMPLFTPTTVLQGACPCLPQPQYYRGHALVYPNHSFTGGMPLFTPTTVLRHKQPVATGWLQTICFIHFYICTRKVSIFSYIFQHAAIRYIMPANY